MIEFVALMLFLIVIVGMVFGPSPYHRQLEAPATKRVNSEPQPQSAA